MHAFDLGLSRHFFGFVLQLASKHGVMEELNDRLSSFPKFPGNTRITNLLQKLVLDASTKVTLQACEYRDLMKVLPAALTGLFRGRVALEKDLQRCLHAYLLFYECVVSDEHTSSSLLHLETLADKLSATWLAVLRTLSASELNFVKFHVVCHAAAQIRKWGNARVFDVESFEA